jgi:hypothetical protein
MPRTRRARTLATLAVFAVTIADVRARAEASEAPSTDAQIRRVSAGESGDPITETVGEVDRDRQAFALGAEIGVGWAWVSGIPNAGTPFLTLTPTFDVGLSPGGARKPWSAQFFVSVALMPDIVGRKFAASYPDRFTRLGVSLMYRPDSGRFDHQWLSVGWGIASTSTGAYTPAQVAHVDPLTGAFVPASGPSVTSTTLPIRPLLEVGVGLYEMTSTRSRIGIALDVPVEVSSVPGIAAIVSIYGQIGRSN